MYCLTRPTDGKPAYIILMWLEDFILEIPMIAIAVHISEYLTEELTVILVIFGGILGVGVAAAETFI